VDVSLTIVRTRCLHRNHRRLHSRGGRKKYGPGVTDTEIKIGNIAPYSGPASAFGILARVQDAYFKKINSEGGINGRKIKFISYDDAYSPPKTVEQARKLVESDEVLLIFSPIHQTHGSATKEFCSLVRWLRSNGAHWSQYEIPPLTNLAAQRKRASMKAFK
jgi:branched-chain amino acid transport system substrate-binding protein